MATSSFGKNVKELMRVRGITPADIMKAFGVKQGTVSDWLRDRRGLPEGPTILKFAKLLRVSVEELIKDVDDDYDAMRRKATMKLAGDDLGAEGDVATEVQTFLALPRQLRRWLIDAGPALWDSLQRSERVHESGRARRVSGGRTKPESGRRR